jgi:choline transport protein
MAITILLSLIALASAAALSALLSLVVAALYSSYLLVCGLLLWHRVTGGFRPYESDPPALHDGRLTWGPWKIPEPFGTANNVFACVYCALLLFWSFWPQTSSPTPDTANWSILVFGCVILFSIAWYALRARRTFKGPIKEI